MGWSTVGVAVVGRCLVGQCENPTTDVGNGFGNGTLPWHYSGQRVGLLGWETVHGIGMSGNVNHLLCKKNKGRSLWIDTSFN